jgi:hypothetical protein
MKRCLSCNQFFEDFLTICPTDNSALENVRDNSVVTSPAQGVPVAQKTEEIGKQPESRSKPPVQFDLDTQNKETGKFNIKDVAGWDSMIKSVGAAAAKPKRGTADSGNAMQKAANKSGDTQKPNKPTADPPAFANSDQVVQKSPAASPGSGSAAAIGASIVKPGERATPEASTMPSSTVPTNKTSDMSGRIDAEPNFDSARFEQPVNKKAEARNPSAREVEKVDSIIISGHPRAAEAGMTKSARTSLKFSRSMTPQKRRIPVFSVISVILVLILLVAAIVFYVVHH